jgi:hypothetical protein
LEGSGLELAKQYSAIVLDPCVGQELARRLLGDTDSKRAGMMRHLEE